MNRRVKRMAVRGGLSVQLLIQLVREILHLSGKSQEFQKPLAVHGNHTLEV